MGQASGKSSLSPSLSRDDVLGTSVLNFVVSRGGQFPTSTSTSSAAGGGPADVSSDPIGAWQNELYRQTRNMQKVANITYEDFLNNIKHLNEISSHYLDENGKRMVFAVKKGSDSTILWKATVKIACVKIDTNSKEIDSYKTINLKQFLQVFNHLKHQADAVGFSAGEDKDKCKQQKEVEVDLAEASGEGASGANPNLLDQLSAAAAISASNDDNLCCICLERKPELILPCAHLYCLPCIEQWTTDHKTCPVCRETLSSTDDGWVVSDTPDNFYSEITTEIQKSLLSLTK